MKAAKRYLFGLGTILLTQAYEPISLPIIVVCGLIVTTGALVWIEFAEFKAFFEKDRAKIESLEASYKELTERLNAIESGINLTRVMRR